MSEKVVPAWPEKQATVATAFANISKVYNPAEEVKNLPLEWQSPHLEMPVSKAESSVTQKAETTVFDPNLPLEWQDPSHVSGTSEGGGGQKLRRALRYHRRFLTCLKR